MSATTQSRISKQPQLKQKAAEATKPRLPQPTTEQLRMAELLQKGNASQTDAEIAEKLKALCEAGNCSEEDALFALGEAEYDLDRALNLLIERPDGLDCEWQQATAKKNKKTTTTSQVNGDRDINLSERDGRNMADVSAKRSRGTRGRPHATQNGDGDSHRDRENGRSGRGRQRPPRSNGTETHDGNAAHRTDADDGSATITSRTAVNGYENDTLDTPLTSEENEWLPARTRNDSRSKRGRAETGPHANGEQSENSIRGSHSRRGETRSVNRVAGRGSAQRGGMAARGRSAGPQHNDAWRTYSRTPRTGENGDTESYADVEHSGLELDPIGSNPQTIADAAGVNPEAHVQGANKPSEINKSSRGNASHEKTALTSRPYAAAVGDRTRPAAASATADDTWAEEWDGGSCSWQNTDARTVDSASSQKTDSHVLSFASIVAQKSAGATHANQAHVTAVQTPSSSSDAKPQQTVSNPSVPVQPTTSISAALPASVPQVSSQTPSNTIAQPQQQPQPQSQPQPQQQQQQQQSRTEDSAAIAQRPATNTNTQQLTQKIELSDLLSKSTSQSQTAVSAPTAQGSVGSVAQRPVTATYSGVPSGLSQQNVALSSLNPPSFTPAAVPANLAVGSQTQAGIGRSLTPSGSATINQSTRSLQDEAVVMPFKVSETLSSAFQFGFNADYVNPNSTPFDSTANRVQTQPVSFAPPSSNAGVAQTHGAFVDSLTKQQQSTIAQQQQASRPFGVTPMPIASQPTGAPQAPAQTQTGVPTLQSQPAPTVSAVATGLNRITLDNESATGSAMKATANAFVPAHLGSASQQGHTESGSVQSQRGEVVQFSSSGAQQFFPYSVNQQQNTSHSSAPQQHPVANVNSSQQQPVTSSQQSHSHTTEAVPPTASTAQLHANPVGASQQQASVITSNASAAAQPKQPAYVESSRPLGSSLVGTTSLEDSSNYAQPPRGQAPGAAASQAHLQHMFSQIANLFNQNVPQPQSQAAGQTGPPTAPGPLSSAGTGFNAPPGAPGQTQPYNMAQFAVYQPYHSNAAFAQAQQLFSLLQHAPHQSAQQQFAAASQSQSAAVTGTPTQSTTAPPFGTAAQFNMGLPSSMVGGASATQSGAGAPQSAAQQANTAKLLAAAASGGGFASQSYATGNEDSAANTFGTSSMFVSSDYQRQPGVVPGYQPKGGATEYAFKQQPHVGVVGAPMIDKSGAGTYYSATGASQVPPSSNPPPGLGGVAGGQSTVSALNAANFGMYAAQNAAAHHPYMMTQTHPSMFLPSGMVSAAGAIGAQKAATPTKPPGFQPTGNWQQPY